VFSEGWGPLSEVFLRSAEEGELGLPEENTPGLYTSKGMPLAKEITLLGVREFRIFQTSL
jgi:hypothetical protein